MERDIQGVNLVPARVGDELRRRIGYAVTVAVAVMTTFFLHEGAHWLAGELLGNDMTMTLNVAYPTSRRYLEASHLLYVAAAGPLVTLLQAILACWINVRFPSVWSYPFLLTPVVMRALALLVNMSRPQDEARVSLALGLGSATLPLIVCAILATLAIAASRRNGYSRRFNGLSIVLVITFSSAVILAS